MNRYHACYDLAKRRLLLTQLRKPVPAKAERIPDKAGGVRR